MSRDREHDPRFKPDPNKSAVERLAEIRIEIEAAKLEKLRAEAEAARVAAEPSEYTPYQDYPPPSPADRELFILRLTKMFKPYVDRNNYLLDTLVRDNPDVDVEGLRGMLGIARAKASAVVLGNSVEPTPNEPTETVLDKALYPPSASPD